MTDYQRTLDWLYALEAAKGMDFKLERITLALGRLGDPHRAAPVLHVAGTNGKGSVVAMCDAILRAGGHRVGRYTSPHLVALGERICIDGVPLAPEAIVALADEVRAAASGIELTFFEFLTVMAFLHFARAGVDAAVVEVGLGGRLDATNVVDPLVAAVTTIGVDHAQWLGDTPEAIAAEKGGIIKPGRPVVLGRIAEPAATVLRRIAAERQAPVVAAGEQYHVGGGEQLTFDGLGWHLADLPLALHGAHQRDNAGTALAMLATASAQLPVGADAVRCGLAGVDWPGRLEIVPGAPLTILDGAHNADGVQALLAALPQLAGTRPVHLLFAVMGDKDWPAMIEPLGRRCRTVTVTEVLPPRGAAAAPIAAAFAPWCPAVAEPDVVRAWAHARQQAGPDGVLVVAGSLFLVGAVHAHGLARAATPVEPREAPAP